MDKKVAVFIDVSNQFYTINKKWEGRKLDYSKYKRKCEEYGTILRAFAYGTQIEGTASKFISCLFHIDFEPKYETVEKNNWYVWDVGMAMDMVRMSDKVDTVIIGSSANTMTHVISYLKEKGIRVIVMGCGLSRKIKDSCDQYIEITEDYLEQQVETEIVN